MQPLVVLAGALLLAWCCACIVGVSAQVMCGCILSLYCAFLGLVSLLSPTLCAGPNTVVFGSSTGLSKDFERGFLRQQQNADALPASPQSDVGCPVTHTLCSPAPMRPQVCCLTPQGYAAASMRCCLVALHPQRHTLTNCMPSHAEHCCAYSRCRTQ